MKKIIFIILIAISSINAYSIDNGVGVYFNIGGGFDKRDINNDKSSINLSYGLGAYAYNVNEYKIYYGIKAGGDFGKIHFTNKDNFHTLKIQGEIGYRIEKKTDVYFILGYEKFIINYTLKSAHYRGLGFGIGGAKTVYGIFRLFSDFTYYILNDHSLDDTIDDARINCGIIIKD